MKTIYTSMLFENKHLIIKTIEGKEPFVIATVYAPEVAAEICQLLNEKAQKEELS